jgi:hypothetical protein
MRDKDALILENLYQNEIYASSVLEAYDDLGAKTKPIDPKELVDYINRVSERKTKEKDKKFRKNDPYKRRDYLTKPHIHASITKKIIITTPQGEKVDLEQFKQIISIRPDNILRQNDKMKASETVDTIFYNTSLPALKGLVVNEDTGEFVIVDTCPNAGNCQLVCYAKWGSYILFPEVSLSQNKTLNYLFNDSEGFKLQLENEIKKVAKRYEGKKQVQIRWNDSGDLLSQKFFGIVMDIVNNTSMVDHYIYTKEVAMIKAYPNPPKNVIFNFSYGAKREQENLIDPVKDKVSYIVDTKDDKKEPILNTIIKFKYIEKKGDDWEYNNVDATKNIIAQRYNIDPNYILTIDELSTTPKGKEGLYNVIVLPGESDLSASRRDVRGTYLIIH